MPEAVKPVFLVDAYSDPVLVRIDGRASFMNSPTLRDFFQETLRQGRTRFVLDFLHCSSMDSTFLGVLAGAALQIRKLNPPGSFVLCRLGPRNLELVENLGLHRLLRVAPADFAPAECVQGAPLTCVGSPGELENARLVLEAHENLVAADAGNQGKFQDVLAFLRGRLAQS